MSLDLSALDGPPLDLLPGGQARAPLDAFEEDPNQPRQEFEGDPGWGDFVADIKERGILQPIVVRREGHKLRICYGARRFRAARELQMAAVPYVVTDDPRQLDDYAQVAENEQRRNLQPLDLAAFIARKVEAGEKKKVIADKLRISPGSLTFLLALIDPPPFLLELYHSHRCRSPYLLYQLRQLYDKNSGLVLARCTDAQTIDTAFIAALTAEIGGDALRRDPAAGTPADDGTAIRTEAGAGQASRAGEPAEDGSSTTVATPPADNPDASKAPLTKTAARNLKDVRAALKTLADAYEALLSQIPDAKPAALKPLTAARRVLTETAN